MLRISWLIENENKEIKAYDLLGRGYYYQGDIQKAFHFHNKMISGQLVNNQFKKLSNIQLINRQYANNKLTLKYLNSGSCNNKSENEDDNIVSSSDDEF